jgi:hypothetical protein
MMDCNDIIMKDDLNENDWEDVKARFHKMAKTVRLIRFAISVSLFLTITGMIPSIIFTLDKHDADDVRGKSFELLRDQQKGTGQIQSQSTDRKKPTRVVVGADLGEPQIIHKMASKVVQRVEKARK